MPDVPAYMAAAAREGLDLRAEGYGGDGLTDGTIREAREIAAGRMSDGKVIRANAWAARHAVDLEAPQNRDPDHDDWPGNGAVAHYLWGIDPTDPQPARRWLEREAARLQDGRGDTMTNVEKRDITVEDFEIREAGDGYSFTGYAAVFNSDSQPLPFVEQIAPGAFKRSLNSRNNIRMLLNHDTSRVLATTRAKTMRLSEDERGLKVEADLPRGVSYAEDLAVLMKRGDINAMSFGFSVPRGGDTWSEDGSRRTLREVRLHEVSVVTFPAYEATSAAVRDYSRLASRAMVDVDELTAAIDALAAGEQLSPEAAQMLMNVVGTLSASEAADEMPAEDEGGEITIETKVPTSVLKKQLELLASELGMPQA